MIDTKTRVLQITGEVGAGAEVMSGRHGIHFAVGKTANRCALVADDGGGLSDMLNALRSDANEPLEAVQQHFAAAIAGLCSEVSSLVAARPGDAIRDAFFWTGWCHDGAVEGYSVWMYSMMSGRGVPPHAQELSSIFSNVLMRELVTTAAIEVAYGASKIPGRKGYWARRWKVARSLAVAETFPEGPPANIRIWPVFEHKVWSSFAAP